MRKLTPARMGRDAFEAHQLFNRVDSHKVDRLSKTGWGTDKVLLNVASSNVFKEITVVENQNEIAEFSNERVAPKWYLCDKSVIKKHGLSGTRYSRG